MTYMGMISSIRIMHEQEIFIREEVIEVIEILRNGKTAGTDGSDLSNGLGKCSRR